MAFITLSQLSKTVKGLLNKIHLEIAATDSKLGVLTDLSTDAKNNVVAAINEVATNSLTSETDPTVPSWAKKSTKPTYTASEVGALPSTTIYAGAAVQGGAAEMTASIPMGQVDSTSTSTAFTATVPGITELRDGVCVWLRNGVVTSGSGFTININGLGAKPVYGSLAAATRATSQFNVNYTMLFIYNSSRVSGGCWDAVYGYDSNTTYTPPKLGFCYVNVGGEANDTSKIGTNNNYVLSTGGIVVGRFLYDAPAGSTLNISGRGAKPIYFRNAALPAGVIKGGDTVTLVYYPERYYLMSIDRWQVDIGSLQSTVSSLQTQLNNLVVADNVGY